ncbi:MAG: hypothetical protein GX989_08425 [Firmicutes bacterium]|nr:hypothetical protein [Bacillota bacterium]
MKIELNASYRRLSRWWFPVTYIITTGLKNVLLPLFDNCVIILALIFRRVTHYRNLVSHFSRTRLEKSSYFLGRSRLPLKLPTATAKQKLISFMMGLWQLKSIYLYYKGVFLNMAVQMPVAGSKTDKGDEKNVLEDIKYE